MKIQVIGSGCATCKALFELTQKAVAELNIEEEVEYITDISEIIKLGVMSSPVLAIDGVAVMTGSTTDIEKIKNLIVNGSETDDRDGCSCCSSCNCSSC